jgi:isopenicillin-N N-acyltransferase-like protein
VALSIDAYAVVYREMAGLRWADALAVARPFAAAIEQFEPRSLEEMRGLAEGAAQELDAILALNVRTEIMLSAKAREAHPPGECTAIVALPSITESGHTLVAQNWDWLPHTTDTLVVLEARQDAGPAYVSVVEAGLLAKAGMNSNGVGIATNALIGADDAGDVGVPYHVTLRGLLDAEGLPAALASLRRRWRSPSANYLVAQAGGRAVNVEARPGGHSGLVLTEPQEGLLVHTNHFLATPDVVDVGISWMADSPFRLTRARELLRQREGPVSIAGLQAVLTDHEDHPASICAHADLRDPPLDQGQTAASLIMDLDERLLWLADGNPCTTGYRRLDYSGLLGSAGS